MSNKFTTVRECWLWPWLRFMVFRCDAEYEKRWASVAEWPNGAYFLAQPEAQSDSATSILARGVKRRLHGGLPSEFNSHRGALCPEKLNDGPTACKAFRGKQPSLLSQAGQSDGMAAGWGSAPVHAEQPDQPVSWFKRITIPNTWQLLEESDADVAVDVDCCGDSGSTSKLSSRSQGVSASGSNRPVHRWSSRVACRPLPALPEQGKSCPGPTKTISAAPAKQHIQVRTT